MIILNAKIFWHLKGGDDFMKLLNKAAEVSDPT